ncbi:MAG: hypothetical protein RMK91_06120 [Pseudanabaenaceae cyanobacterium SKYGB_i_bin29]|nr:hypothetical protein [Pseudanabaenaceae cyanobacterium SKYG29]MDW8421428.1 hypothetical protein [Pseudanabaenaceae cyanobacterium SKYGB_i_bin29]
MTTAGGEILFPQTFLYKPMGLWNTKKLAVCQAKAEHHGAVASVSIVGGHYSVTDGL